jgi:hypothetical protein
VAVLVVSGEGRVPYDWGGFGRINQNLPCIA